MTTTIRILKGDNSGFYDIPNPFGMRPNKGDTVVYREQQLTVLYLEWDFDTNTLFIVCS